MGNAIAILDVAGRLYQVDPVEEDQQDEVSVGHDAVDPTIKQEEQWFREHQGELHGAMPIEMADSNAVITFGRRHYDHSFACYIRAGREFVEFFCWVGLSGRKVLQLRPLDAVSSK